MNVKIRNKLIEIKYSVSNGLLMGLLKLNTVFLKTDINHNGVQINKNLSRI